jgi:hypothetical protein
MIAYGRTDNGSDASREVDRKSLTKETFYENQCSKFNDLNDVVNIDDDQKV